MKIQKMITMSLIALLPLLAQAHVHLEKSMPTARSSGVAPAQFMLEFAEAVQVTALTIEKEGGKGAQKLEPLPSKPSKSVQVAAPKLDPGNYILIWRAVGDDGHIMSGSIPFTVIAK